MGFRNPITTAIDPTAREQAAAALTAANGKNKLYGPSSLAPSAPAGGFVVGDQWLQTIASGGVALKVWTVAGGVGSWTAQAFGAGTLAAGAVVAGSVAAGAIDGMTITGVTVQTGAGTGPGTKLYQDTKFSTSASSGRGILELDDGVSGNVGSTLIRTPGTPQSDFQGGSVVLAAGKFWGTYGPNLKLLIAQTPDGAGIVPHVEIDQPLYVQGALINGDSGWLPCGIKSGYAAYTDAPLARVLDGVVYMAGGYTSAGMSPNSQFVVGTLPGGVPPPHDIIFLAGGGSVGSALGALGVYTNGNIVVRTGATVSSFYKFAGISWPAT